MSYTGSRTSLSGSGELSQSVSREPAVGCHDDDQQSVGSFQRGDERAFDILYERHHRSVLNLAYRLLGNHDAAQDVAQEVFTKLYASPRSYRPKGRFSTWLYRVTYNACIDEMRKRKATSLEQMDGGHLPARDASCSPESVAESNELVAAVRTAISELPPNQRAAIILQRYEGQSYQEIADALKTSVSAVESLLVRAKQSLKAKLAPYVETI